ncbi:MAG: hypothetical protein ACRECO_07470 [Xanthobacteraceae bacterium]
MLPIDPEREVAGRSIAAVLMAKQIKQSGEIHAETLLTEIGALAGFAAQMSIRKTMIEGQGLDADSILVEVVTKNDEKYYFSDVLNWILFENMNSPPYSIWAYVSAAVPEDLRLFVPDISAIVSNAARTIGTRRFGVPRVPPAHVPRKLPRVALDEHWRSVQDELTATRRHPSEWPYDLAAAAQWQMVTSRDGLPPHIAAGIIMEAAIPMSKIDPNAVPGA